MPRYLDKPVQIPSQLIKHPCKAVGAGTTLKSLSQAYIKNTSCIGKYAAVVSGIKRYNDEIPKFSEKEK